jgi:hypothetical protein
VAEPRSLAERIDAEVRGRIEEAVDYICLDVLVRGRRVRGAAPPVADDPRDREEFDAIVVAFLEHLRDTLTAALTNEQQRRLPAAPRGGADRVSGLVAIQVVLAKELPDYWLRFDVARASYSGEPPPSRGDGRGLLARLFRRG